MLLPHMISYAQNGEDVVLRRAFAEQAVGFWIDIGACDPVLDSVTLHFAKNGWNGINVEPDADLFAKLQAARPADINVQVAITEDAALCDFFPTGTRGHGTLVEEIAGGRTPNASYKVRSMTLSALMEEFVPKHRPIDFLKIDVEGYEHAVLSSGDWKRHRPRIVLIEAVDERGAPTHETWEDILLSNGYVRSLFDGLNRWYCRSEEPEIIEKLIAPANVLDNWTRADYSSLLEEFDRVSRRLKCVENVSIIRQLWCALKGR